MFPVHLNIEIYCCINTKMRCFSMAILPCAFVMMAVLIYGPCHVVSIELSSSWGFEDPVTYPGWANIMFSSSNPETMETAAANDMKVLYPISWTVARPGPQPCISPISRFDPFTCKTMRPDYLQAWKQTFTYLEPWIKNKTVVGIFLGDENLWDGASLQNLTVMANLIRSDWPDALIYINEAQDVLMCNYNRMNESVFSSGECVPSNVDYIGFDIYAFDATSWQDSQQGFVDNVYPRLSHKGQRVIPTTGSYGSRVSPQWDWSVEDYDAFCAKNARAFIRWALSDERVGGVFPWHWPSYGASVAPFDIGLVDLPHCRATWMGFGEIVMNQYASKHVEPSHQYIRVADGNLSLKPQDNRKGSEQWLQNIIERNVRERASANVTCHAQWITAFPWCTRT